MFVRPLHYDDENTIYLLAGNIRMNVEYAISSLKSIMTKPLYDKTIFENKFVYYFFHLQSLLTACGNICNTFYNAKGLDFNTRKYSHELYINQRDASKELRQIFKIDREHFPLVFNKDFRNTTLHSDERVMEYNGKVGDYNILEYDTPKEVVEEILNTPHLRTLDLRTMTYYSYNRKKNQISIDLNILLDELKKIKEILENNQNLKI